MGVQDRQRLHVVPFTGGLFGVLLRGFRHAGGVTVIPLRDIDVDAVLKLLLVPARTDGGVVGIELAHHVVEKDQLFGIDPVDARLVEEIPPAERRVIHVSDHALHHRFEVRCGDLGVLQVDHAVAVFLLQRIEKFLHRIGVAEPGHRVVMEHVEAELLRIFDLLDIHRIDRQRRERFAVQQRNLAGVVADRRNRFMVRHVHGVQLAIRGDGHGVQPLIPAFLRPQ